MRIVPVNFKSEHKAMLGHCKMILENDGGRVAINPDKFDKLITALRTAVDNDGTLDKEATEDSRAIIYSTSIALGATLTNSHMSKTHCHMFYCQRLLLSVFILPI
jgi:hypothetical protein